MTGKHCIPVLQAEAGVAWQEVLLSLAHACTSSLHEQH